MAWRIHDSVVRGEVDNRVKGRVRGQIWLEGWSTPLELDLRGNAHPDLAGCLLTFTNPLARIKHPSLDGLNPQQRGTVGDITASRKVRVMEIPMPEAYLMKKRGEHVPEHLANCLYLEWFSEANGRVVIESTDYELTVSAPEWRLTPEEERVEPRTQLRVLPGLWTSWAPPLRNSSTDRRTRKPRSGTSAISRSS